MGGTGERICIVFDIYPCVIAWDLQIGEEWRRRLYYDTLPALLRLSRRKDCVVQWLCPFLPSFFSLRCEGHSSVTSCTVARGTAVDRSRNTTQEDIGNSLATEPRKTVALDPSERCHPTVCSHNFLLIRQSRHTLRQSQKSPKMVGDFAIMIDLCKCEP